MNAIASHSATDGDEQPVGWQAGPLPVVALICTAVAVGIMREVRAAYGPFNEWSVGEWLINYHGGFIRRGLPGAVIHWLATVWHVSPITSAVTVSLVSHAVLVVLVLRRSAGLFLPAAMLSPIMLGAPPLGGFLIRKDAFILVLFALALAMASAAAAAPSPLRRAAAVVACNVWAIIAILSHESFAFFGLPALLLVATASDGRLRPLRAIAWLFPSLAAFAAVLMHTGSPAHAAAIHASWQDLSPPLPPGRLTDPTGPWGMIWVTRGPADRSLGILRLVLTKVDHHIFWEPAMWAVTAVVALFIMSRLRPPTVAACFSAADRSIRFSILFQAAAVVPLFIWGYDWGRWIFLWFASGVVLAPSLGLVLEPLRRNVAVVAVVDRLPRSDRFVSSSVDDVLPWFLLVFGNPGWSWELTRYAKSTPLGTLLDLVMP